MPDPSDPISTLQALGFEMPSIAYFVGVCAFSVLGWIAYRRGKARAMPGRAPGGWGWR